MEKEITQEIAKDLVNRYVKNKQELSSADINLAEQIIKETVGVDPKIIGGETMRIMAIEKRSTKKNFDKDKISQSKKISLIIGLILTLSIIVFLLFWQKIGV